jgi:C1A family cysteine protease
MANSLRQLTTTLVVLASSVLAACGVATSPMSRPVNGVSSLAGRQAAATRRYGLTFDAQTPKVKFVGGRLSAGQPSQVDLRPQMSPIDDQGALNSCTGFAIAGLAEFRALTKLKSRRAIELSPSFIYKLELLAENNTGEDSGARIRTGMVILQDRGTCPEAVHPYLEPAKQNDHNLVRKWLNELPTAAQMSAAAPYKIIVSKNIEDLSQFKAALAKGRPVVFGIMCAKSFESDAVKQTGMVPVPDPALEPFVGGHAIMAIGYDEAKKHVIFRNSYGPTWGDKGYGYLPYAYFKKELVGDAWEAE